jgi:hypothetical protein
MTKSLHFLHLCSDQKAANVQLSYEETYADISPVREVNSISAFVSIMRGCNNMCSCESSSPFYPPSEDPSPAHSLMIDGYSHYRSLVHEQQ